MSRREAAILETKRNHPLLVSEFEIASIVIGVGATIFFGWFLAYHYHKKGQGYGQKPLLDVRVSTKEDRFRERLEVQILNQTNYTYRIKVAGTYLKWEKNNKETISLAPGTASGVILDEVVSELEDHPIIIEALNWRRWPLSPVVYKRHFKNI